MRVSLPHQDGTENLSQWVRLNVHSLSPAGDLALSVLDVCTTNRMKEYAASGKAGRSHRRLCLFVVLVAHSNPPAIELLI